MFSSALFLLLARNSTVKSVANISPWKELNVQGAQDNPHQKQNSLRVWPTVLEEALKSVRVLLASLDYGPSQSPRRPLGPGIRPFSMLNHRPEGPIQNPVRQSLHPAEFIPRRVWYYMAGLKGSNISGLKGQMSRFKHALVKPDNPFIMPDGVISDLKGPNLSLPGSSQGPRGPL